MPATAPCPCCPPDAMTHVTLPVLRRAQAAEQRARRQVEKAEEAVDAGQQARQVIVRWRIFRVVFWGTLVLGALVLVASGKWLTAVALMFAVVWIRAWWRKQMRDTRRAKRSRGRKLAAHNRRAAGKPKVGSRQDLADRVALRAQAHEQYEEALLALTLAEHNTPALWRFPGIDPRVAARVDAGEDADGVV